jgi:hypothetical protein
MFTSASSHWADLPQRLSPDSQSVSTNHSTNQTLLSTPDTGQTVTPLTGQIKVNQTNDVDILHILIAATSLLLFSALTLFSVALPLPHPYGRSSTTPPPGGVVDY